MISVPRVRISRLTALPGKGESLRDLAMAAARHAADGAVVRGVVAATFSNPARFPSLAVSVAAALGLPSSVPAFDLQMACSAWPYALYLAGRLAGDVGGSVLVLDGDVQSPFVNAADAATASVFSDGMSACLVSVGEGCSRFAFLSQADAALTCPAEGPIVMDGFRVFQFVATDVVAMLRGFLADLRAAGDPEPDWFAPHQANPYMVRQLAKAVGLEDRLLKLDENLKNPGSCSVPMTLARAGRCGSALVAGFGAGLSAAVGTVEVEGIL